MASEFNENAMRYYSDHEIREVATKVYDQREMVKERQSRVDSLRKLTYLNDSQLQNAKRAEKVLKGLTIGFLAVIAGFAVMVGILAGIPTVPLSAAEAVLSIFVGVGVFGTFAASTYFFGKQAANFAYKRKHLDDAKLAQTSEYKELIEAQEKLKLYKKTLLFRNKCREKLEKIFKAADESFHENFLNTAQNGLRPKPKVIKKHKEVTLDRIAEKEQENQIAKQEKTKNKLFVIKVKACAKAVNWRVQHDYIEGLRLEQKQREEAYIKMRDAVFHKDKISENEK